MAEGEKDDSERLLELLAGLEASLPLERGRLEALLQTKFRTPLARFFSGVLAARTTRFRVELRLPKLDFPGSLSLHFTPAMASGSQSALLRRLPGGRHVPPPPPGHGAPAGIEGGYVVDRPWGRVWVTLQQGDRVAGLAFDPGVHGSPGV
jgi:hypothetical protein